MNIYHNKHKLCLKLRNKDCDDSFPQNTSTNYKCKDEAINKCMTLHPYDTNIDNKNKKINNEINKLNYEYNKYKNNIEGFSKINIFENIKFFLFYIIEPNIYKIIIMFLILYFFNNYYFKK